MKELGLNIRLIPDGGGVKVMVNGVKQDLAAMGKTGVKAGKSIDRQFGKTRAGVESISQQLGVAKAQFLGFVGVQFGAQQITQLVGMADAAKNMNARLALATTGAEEYTRAQEALFEISQRNKVALQGSVNLYARLAPAYKEAGRSQAELLEMTELIGQATAISGGSVAESGAAILQFAQAMGSGVLRGDEFNSVNEQAGRLMIALADGLGVARASLKGLAGQGKLTADVVLAALSSQAGVLNKEMETMPLTVARASVALRDNFLKQVAGFDSMTEASQTLADGVIWVSENIDVLAGAAATLAAVVAGKLAQSFVASTAEQVKSTIATRAQIIASKQAADAAVWQHKALVQQYTAAQVARGASDAYVVSLRAQVAESARATMATRTHAVALQKSASVMRGLRAVMSGLGGPVGLITGAATALYLWSSSASAADKNTGDLADSTKRLAGAMGDVNAQGASRQIALIDKEIVKTKSSIARYETIIGLIKKGSVGSDREVANRIEQQNNLLEKQKESLIKLNAKRAQAVVLQGKINGFKTGGVAKFDASGMIQSLNDQRHALSLTGDELLIYQAALKASTSGAAQGVDGDAQAIFEAALAQGRARIAGAEQAKQEAANQSSFDQASSQFGSLQSTLLSEEDQLQASWDKRAQIIQDGVMRGGISVEAANAAQYAMQSQHEDAVLAMKRQKRAAQLGVAAGLFGSLAALAEQGGKRSFAAYKALSVAETLMSTYAAAQLAYHSQMALKTPDAPVRAALAAGAAIASGLARLAMIKSTTLSSSGSSVSGGGDAVGGGIGGAPYQPVAPVAGQRAQGGVVINVVNRFEGSVYGLDDFDDRVRGSVREGFSEGYVYMERDDYNAELFEGAA